MTTTHRNKAAHLMASGFIGDLFLRNRIVMDSMALHLTEAGGRCGEQLCNFYVERAQGGTALMIVGHGAVSVHGHYHPRQLALYDDQYLTDLQKLTQAVHLHNGKIACQLHHAGSLAFDDMVRGEPIFVPSAVKKTQKLDPQWDHSAQQLTTEKETAQLLRAPLSKESPPNYQPMEKSHIEQVSHDFVTAAVRVKKSGFNGIELDATHESLLGQFLSPLHNRRQDEYGGSIENRARLLSEIIRAVKIATSYDFPIWVRLDAQHPNIPNELESEEILHIALFVATAGADAIHLSTTTSAVSFCNLPQNRTVIPDELTEYLHKNIDIPIILSADDTPLQAYDIIRKKNADFVAMGKQLLADPHLPLKLLKKRSELVRPCIGCHVCHQNALTGQSIRCAVNPAAGRESQYELKEAPKSRNIVVVGGGPAGMEVARIAAERGHSVQLREQNRYLGGSLILLAIACPSYHRYLKYLRNMLRERNVSSKCKYRVDVNTVHKFSSATIIAAIGSKYLTSPIVGANQKHVLGDDWIRRLITGEGKISIRSKMQFRWRLIIGLARLCGVMGMPSSMRVLSKWTMPLHKKIIIVGDNVPAYELAIFCATRKREVTLLEENKQLGHKLSFVHRWYVMQQINELGVKVLNGITIDAIDLSGVIYSDGTGRHKISGEHIIVSQDGSENNELVMEFKHEVGEKIQSVGYCKKRGEIAETVESAYDVGYTI